MNSSDIAKKSMTVQDAVPVVRAPERFRSDEGPCASESGRPSEAGTATLIAVLVVALLGMFVAASLSRVTTGITLANNDVANARAFYAAQASLEMMTLNFSKIFSIKLSPSLTDIQNAQGPQPNLQGFTFSQVISNPPNPPGSLNKPASQTVTIINGPFAGLVSLRTNYQLDATATYGNNAQVHLTRSFYNHQVPIFQFGIFYDSDLEVYPGPPMYFSGRVHSNGNIYMLSGDNGGPGLHFENKVTTVGEIIRDWNRNGTSSANWAADAVWVADSTGNDQRLPLSNGGNFFGSAKPSGGTSGNPANPQPGWQTNIPTGFTNWSSYSTATWNGTLLAEQPRLQLPLQLGGANDIELIRRGIANGDYQTSVLGQAADNPILASSRYYNKPGLRVTLSDQQTELPVDSAGNHGGIRLDGDSTGTNVGDTDADGSRGYKPQAMTDGYQAARINGFRLYTGPNYQDNGTAGNAAGAGIPANRQTWIKVEIVNTDVNGNIISSDVTKDFLSLGMTDVAPDLVDANLNPIGDSRAIFKIQHYELLGPPVRVADVNVNDLTAPNTANTTVSPSAGQDSDSYPTTSNYVYNTTGTPIAVGPYNVYTYQVGTAKNPALTNAFNYASMSQNNYTRTMTADPTSAALNGYSVFTNLHQKSDGTLYIPSGSLSSTLANNIWKTPMTPGTNNTTTCPAAIGGFTSAPTYPAGYSMNTTFAVPFWQFTLTSTGAGPQFKLSYGPVPTLTANLAFGATPAATAATIQAALAGIASIGAGNVVVVGSGTATIQSFNVYLSNPSKVTMGGLTIPPSNLTNLTSSAPSAAGADQGFAAVSTTQYYQFSLTSAGNNTFKIGYYGAAPVSVNFVSGNANTTATNITNALCGLTAMSIPAGAGTVQLPAGRVNVVPTSSNANTQTFTVAIAPLNFTCNATTPAFTLSSLGAGLSAFPSTTPPLITGPSSLGSIEAQKLGIYAAIQATTPRLETVVPFPIEIFDPREGNHNANMTVNGAAPAWDSIYPNGTTDGNASTWRGANIPVGGVMSMLDIDVFNLRAFLNNTAAWRGFMPNGTTAASWPNNNGWILYVSDRRGDRDDDGEYDMEDIYGPQDGNQDPGEDQNLNGKLDVDAQWESALTYGSPQGSNGPLNNSTAGWSTAVGPFQASWTITAGTNFPATVSVPNDVAAFFDHSYFRRGVRLINCSKLPGSTDLTTDTATGFTLASENPVYVDGNYGAQGVTVGPAGGKPTPPANYVPYAGNLVAGAVVNQIIDANDPTDVQVPSSIVADAIMPLSTSWQDGNSFRNPYNNNSGTTQSTGQPNGKRVATQTTVRAAFLMGSPIASLRPDLGGPGKWPTCQGGNDICLDGGVHNFPRFLEDWSGGVQFNYTGSLINPFASRVAVGAYKNGGGVFVYSPPNRNWSFDVSFTDPNRLPPGTPMFQFIQMTGFRETTAQEQ